MQYELRVRSSKTITPSDTDKLSESGRGILVDAAGAVKVGYQDGTTDTMTLASNVWHPMEVYQVFATGTAATGIHIGW